MIKAIRVYSLAWDTDGGCGCTVYASAAERDRGFREALLSYAKEGDVEGLSADSSQIVLGELFDKLESLGRLEGARYTADAHNI